jgi:Ca2+-binding RTX toxin-like protein
VTGSVTVRGGDGDDELASQSPVAYNTFLGEAGADILTGGDRYNYLLGGEGDDNLTGGAGRDSLVGDGGQDVLLSGGGRDTLDPGLGTDDVHGGTGIDWAYYSSRLVPLSISLDDVANDGETSENDNVHSDVENLQSGGGDDTLTGTNDRNRMWGGGGSDTLNGDGGNDFLYGGGTAGLSGDVLNGQDGDDRLYGEEWSADTFSGGAGWDFVPFERGEDVRVSLNNQPDDGVDGELDNVMSDVEEVTTGWGDDVVVGSNAGNEFTTGLGNDTVSGGGGNDGLVGGAGRDVLNGGNGIDSLEGQEGGDTLVSQDSARDYVDCGGALDSLDRDATDRVGANCEILR